MKVTVLAGCVLVAGLGVGLMAQGGGEQTIMGCVKGDGSEANPWMLTGVVIPPPPPAPPAGRGGAGGGGGRGGGRGDGAAAPAPGGGAPAAGAGGAGGGRGAGGGGGRGGDAAAGGGQGRGGAGRGAPATPPPPPPPPPPPQNFKLVGINMTPWAGMRAEVTGSGNTGGFNVSNVRSMWGTCQ